MKCTALRLIAAGVLLSGASLVQAQSNAPVISKNPTCMTPKAFRDDQFTCPRFAESDVAQRYGAWKSARNVRVMLFGPIRLTTLLPARSSFRTLRHSKLH